MWFYRYFLFAILFSTSCSDNVLINNNLQESVPFSAYEKILSESRDSIKTIAAIDSIYSCIINCTGIDKYNNVKAKLFFFDKKVNNKYLSTSYTDSLLLLSNQYNCRKTESNYLKGQVLYSKGDYNNAFYFYNIAKNSAIQSGDTNTLSNLCYLTGMSLYNQSRFSESIIQLKEAVMFKKLKTFDSEFRRQECFNNIGLCFDELGLIDSSISYYSLAFNDCLNLKANYTSNTEQSSLQEGIAISLRNIGNAFKQLKQFDTAIVLLNNSLNYLCDKNNRLKTTVLLSLAQGYLFKKKLSNAMRIIDTVHYTYDSTDLDLAMLYYTTMLIKDTTTGDFIIAYRNQMKLLDIWSKRLQKVQMSHKADLSYGMKNSQYEFEVELLNKKIENKNLRISINTVALMSFLVMSISLAIGVYLLKKKNKIISSHLNKIKEQKSELEDFYINLQIHDSNKSKLLRSIVHDIINPISTIVATTQIELIKGPNSTSKGALEKIEKAALGIAEMAKELIINAKSEKSVLLKQKHNLIEVLVCCIEECKTLASKKNQKLHLLNSNPTIEVAIDRPKIERVIINIISNAIKFSYPDSEVIINVVCKAHSVIVSFQDFGIGIPKENEHEIFKAFGNAGRIGTENEPTNGLGLSIVKEILSLHMGKIWFTSKESVGTTFYISIPK